MNTYILPYKIGSESAKVLAEQLGCLRIKGDKRLPNNSIVFNWGNSEVHPICNNRRPCNLYNIPEAVTRASDKLRTFSVLSNRGVRIPQTTQAGWVAHQWIEEGATVYGRRYTNSSQGKGIHILTQDDYFIDNLPLYTRGIVGKEYRVHVAFGKIIDFTQKKKRSETEVNEYVRNHSNGWVFAREGVLLPPDAAVQSIKAIDELGLDYGAIDVIVNDNNAAYILEVNTAPGIEGTTLQKYSAAFEEVLYEYRNTTN